MSLITLATYKTITGTTSVTNDSLIELYLIPAVSDAVEAYVHRKLLADDYILWRMTGQYGTINDLYAPVNHVNAVWVGSNSIDVHNYGTAPISLTVTSDQLRITDMGTGVTNSYPFDSYGTFIYSDLCSAVNIDYPTIDMLIASGVTDGPCNILKPETYVVPKDGTANLIGPYDALNVDMPYHDSVKTCQANTYVCISYNGGYTSLPYDLQVAVANMVKDMLAIQLSSTGTPKYKSESQGQYSYSLADGVVPSEILTPYQFTLDRYYQARY